MVSCAEQSISVLVHSLLEKLEPGDTICESEILQDIIKHIEVFATLELRKKYPEWKYECVDGIYISQAWAEGMNQINILGMCILLSDQCLTPIHVQIKIAESYKEIKRMKLELGEIGDSGLIKIPYNSNLWQKKLYTIEGNTINWYYSIEYMNENQ